MRQQPSDLTYEEILAAVEVRLRRLANGLDVAVSGAPLERTLAVGLALQAGQLYGQILAACTVDHVLLGMIGYRSLLDTTILVRWIELDPPLHARMWLAEDDRDRANLGEAFDEFRRRRGRQGAPVFTREQLHDLRAEAKRTRAAAQRAGEPIGDKGSILPQVQEMARRCGDDLWEAYNVAYRMGSPFTHSGGRGLEGHWIDEREDGQHIVADVTWTAVQVRAGAAPAYAMAIASASRQAELDLHSAADEIRVGLTHTWDRPPGT